MSIQDYPQTDQFKEQMRESLQREIKNSRAIKIAKHANVYVGGEQDEMVYFIESGQVKLLTLSHDGRECIVAIHSSGDVFGELCLSGAGVRLETATAMEETKLRVVPCTQLFNLVRSNSLLEGFVRYLSVRIADQQEVSPSWRPQTANIA